MKLAKFKSDNGSSQVGRVEGEIVMPLREDSRYRTLTDILEADDPAGVVETLASSTTNTRTLRNVELLAPIDSQEVWAAGVTYKRSRTARMEESKEAADCYDRVYESPRPELFMKATPHRVVGHGGPLRIRADSEWNVPEPELTLVMNSRLELVGFTIGNDMSSRDIEGENPLYLPQAKVYSQCCGLGPWITLADAMPPREEIGIRLRILRGQERVFSGQTSISELARSFEELIGWLGRDNSFPGGVMLLTGAGIVPDSSFTLRAGDEVEIEIDGIGALRNSIVQGSPTTCH